MPEPSPREDAPEPRGAAKPSRLDRIRAVALPLAIAAAAVLFGRTVHAQYPVQHWLFWRYAEHPGDLPADWSQGAQPSDDVGRLRRIGDFMAGMTDRYALVEHARLFPTTPELR